MPESIPCLLVGGDLGLDIVARPRASMQWGDDTPARVDLVPGGQGANVATWARQAGVRVYLFTQVGRDATGRSLVRDLRARGVRVRARHSERSTLVVSLVEPGRRTLVADIGPGVWADIAPARIEGAGALYLSAYVLNRPDGLAWVRRARRWATRAGVPVAATPSAVSVLERVGPEGWRALSEGAAWLCLNAAEAAAITGDGQPSCAAERLAAAGSTVLVTAGEEGAWVCAPHGAPSRVPPAPVPRDVVDTTGAGDAAAGAFVAHTLLGASLREAAALAMEAAGRAICQGGAWAPA